MNLKSYGFTILTTSTLSAEAVISLVSDTLKTAQEFVKENERELYLWQATNELKRAFEAYEGVKKGQSASQVVKKLEEADQKRDLAYQTLVAFVKAYAFMEDKASSYQQLNQLLKSYKQVTSASYEAETGQIKQLLKQLASADYQEAVSQLNLAVHVSALADAQAQFESIYQDRLNEMETSKAGASRNQKRAVCDAYDYLIDLVAVIAANGSAPESYQGLKNKLNTIRSRYHKRSSKKTAVAPKPDDK